MCAERAAVEVAGCWDQHARASQRGGALHVGGALVAVGVVALDAEVARPTRDAAVAWWGAVCRKEDDEGLGDRFLFLHTE